MDVFTLYAGQGELVALRAGNEGLVIDSHMPDCEEVSAAEIERSLSTYFIKSTVRGLVLTSFDSDHAHPGGIDWILTNLKPDWVMYPKYYKDTDCATEVFKIINWHVQRRANTNHPLVKNSVRIDRLESRYIFGLGTQFSFELFSPHIEDMDCSNNCSIVAKITGLDSGGFSYLLTGDTEVARWERIAALFGTKIASDVMSASHHGSITGVHPQTLLNVSPNTILISAGVDNQFDHPHPAAVAVFSKVAKHVYSTNAGHEPLCLLTRRSGVDFSTLVFRHAAAIAA